MHQAKKERASICKNACDGVEIDNSLEELLISWKEVSKEVKVYTEDEVFGRKSVNDITRELYEELKEKIYIWEKK